MEKQKEQFGKSVLRKQTKLLGREIFISNKPIMLKQEKWELFELFEGSTETFEGVEKPPPRKHIYIGRISTQHDMETVRDYCNENQKGLLHTRKISSEESRYHAFHRVFEMDDIDLEDLSLWPKYVVIGSIA